MKNTIEKLRKKPEHVRIRIAIISSILCTIVIIGIWISTFSGYKGIDNVFSNKKEDGNSEEIAKKNSPFNLIKEQFSNVFFDLKNSFPDIDAGVVDENIEDFKDDREIILQDSTNDS